MGQTIVNKYLPFGIPHGPGVRPLSKKSRGNLRAGGNVIVT